MKRGFINVLFLTIALGGLSSLFASSGSGDTDIAPRTLNFVIFAAILYYLIADPIKAFFVERKAKITSALEMRESKLKAAKSAVVDAEQYLVDSKKLADELLKTANSDVVLLKERAKQAALNEIATLEKQFNDDCELMKKKTVMRAVEEELSQIFTIKGYGVSDQEFAQIFAKKVAQ
jgi:F-type H+-transporting ATPase subunit b